MMRFQAARRGRVAKNRQLFRKRVRSRQPLSRGECRDHGRFCAGGQPESEAGGRRPGSANPSVLGLCGPASGKRGGKTFRRAAKAGSKSRRPGKGPVKVVALLSASGLRCAVLSASGLRCAVLSASGLRCAFPSASGPCCAFPSASGLRCAFPSASGLRCAFPSVVPFLSASGLRCAFLSASGLRCAVSVCVRSVLQRDMSGARSVRVFDCAGSSRRSVHCSRCQTALTCALCATEARRRIIPRSTHAVRRARANSDFLFSSGVNPRRGSSGRDRGRHCRRGRRRHSRG
jgi:hypothetical protein